MRLGAGVSYRRKIGLLTQGMAMEQITEEPSLRAASEILERLRRSGGLVWTDGELIWFGAPQGVLTAQFRLTIAENRESILELLRAESVRRIRAETTPNLVLIEAMEARAALTEAPSVLCVHAIDGGVGSYWELAKNLRGVAKVYGFSAINFIDKHLPPVSLTGIAELYADQFLSLRPRSEAIIIGWSAGGWIALELGRQLSCRGFDTRQLIILDSDLPDVSSRFELPPTAPKNITDDILRRNISDWWRFVAIHTTAEGDNLIPESFWTMSDDQKCQFLIERGDSRRLFNANNAFLAARDSDDIGHLFQLSKVLFEALLDYKPLIYNGPLTVFQAFPSVLSSTVQNGDKCRTAYQWAQTYNKAKLIELVGGHSAPVTGPGAQIVADYIREILS